MEARFGFLRRGLDGRSRDDACAMPPASRERAALGNALAFKGYGDHLMGAKADELVRVLANVPADKLPKVMNAMVMGMDFFRTWEREYLKLPMTGGRGEDLLKMTSDDLARLRDGIEDIGNYLNPWPGDHGEKLIKLAFKGIAKLRADIRAIGRWRASLAASADGEDLAAADKDLPPLAAASEDLSQAEGGGCPNKFSPPAGFYDAVAALDAALSERNATWAAYTVASVNYIEACDAFNADWEDAAKANHRGTCDAANAALETAKANYRAAHAKYEAAKAALPEWPPSELAMKLAMKTAQSSKADKIESGEASC
jgi:hypothetical protein